MYRLGTTLLHVEDPHLYYYELFDRLSNKRIGEITRLCKCKYSMKNGSNHCYHQSFSKEYTVVNLDDGREFSFTNVQFGKILKEVNEEIFGFNRYIKEQTPVNEILGEIRYLANNLLDKADQSC